MHVHVQCMLSTPCLCCRYFRTEESKESVLVIPVGNVTAQTELTYEYGVRRKGRRQTVKDPTKKGVYKMEIRSL